jgi:hypothetical protein
VPKVFGNTGQMLTVEVLFARLASFFAKEGTAGDLSEDFMTKLSTYDFSAPIYVTVSDDMARELKRESFKIAA